MHQTITDKGKINNKKAELEKELMTYYRLLYTEPLDNKTEEYLENIDFFLNEDNPPQVKEEEQQNLEKEITEEELRKP